MARRPAKMIARPPVEAWTPMFGVAVAEAEVVVLLLALAVVVGVVVVVPVPVVEAVPVVDGVAELVEPVAAQVAVCGRPVVTPAPAQISFAKLSTAC